LIGSLINRNANPSSFSTYDQRFVNCFPEITKNAITGEGSIELYKRGGFTGNTIGPASTTGTFGSIVWSGAANKRPTFCFQNTSTGALSVVDIASTTIGGGSIAGTRTSVAAPSGPAACLSETLISGTPYLVVMARKSSDDMHHAWFTSEFGAWTEITDADFVPNINLGTITGSISGTTLTVTVSSTGTNLPIGARLGGNGVYFDATTITAVGTAVAGVGTYTVSQSQSVSAGTMTAYNNWLVGNMVHMDGYAFVMDKNANIWNSDLNSLSSWSATGFVNASSYPDGGVGLARSKDYLIAFQNGSIDFFRNAGNATGSPLSKVLGASIRMGAYMLGPVSPVLETIRAVNDDVFFIGRSLDSGAVGVYKINGTQIVKVSNAAVDKTLNGNPDLYGFAGVLPFMGMQHLVLSYTFSSSGESYAYCLETGVWWVISVSGARINAVAGNASIGYLVSADKSNNIAYTAQLDWQDFGGAMTMTVQTQVIDHGTTKRKLYKALQIVGDIRTTSGNTAISWSDDDYATFSSAHNVDMSTIRPRITRLGSSRRRAWKITDSVNAPFRAQALEIDFDVSPQ